jgi:hypothetical protein
MKLEKSKLRAQKTGLLALIAGLLPRFDMPWSTNELSTTRPPML